MKRRLFFPAVAMSVLLECLLGCAHKEVSDDPNISELDARRLLEVHRQLTMVGDKVWPGYASAQKRLVLVGDKWQWSINVDPLPGYYRPTETPMDLRPLITSTAVAPAYYDESGIKHASPPRSLYNAYSSEQTGLHFKHPVFFIKTVESLNSAGDKTTSEDWVHMSIHELFHNYQDRFISYTPAFVRETTVPFKQEIQTDPNHQAMVHAELEELSQAVCADSTLLVRKHLQHALALRKKRWAYITKNYGRRPDAWEEYEAANEGTARYVEHKVMAHAADFEEGTLLKGDPYFHGFDKMKSKERPEKWCEIIKAPPHKRYWYFLGWSYSLALDRLRPQWKTEVFSTAQFFDHIFSLEHFVQ